MTAGALDRESIAALLRADPPLVEGWLSLAEQCQPNGFDLTLREVATLDTAGRMGAAAGQRDVSQASALPFSAGGWLSLPPGPYLVTFNEVVNLPLDVMALGRARSSLLRSGTALHTAVWDAGYRGRSQALLVVYNPQGYAAQQGARLLQLVFFRLAQALTQGYQGRYQGENMG